MEPIVTPLVSIAVCVWTQSLFFVVMSQERSRSIVGRAFQLYTWHIWAYVSLRTTQLGGTSNDMILPRTNFHPWLICETFNVWVVVSLSGGFIWHTFLRWFSGIEATTQEISFTVKVTSVKVTSIRPTNAGFRGKFWRKWLAAATRCL